MQSCCDRQNLASLMSTDTALAAGLLADLALPPARASQSSAKPGCHLADLDKNLARKHAADAAKIAPFTSVSRAQRYANSCPLQNLWAHAHRSPMKADQTTALERLPPAAAEPADVKAGAAVRDEPVNVLDGVGREFSRQQRAVRPQREREGDARRAAGGRLQAVHVQELLARRGNRRRVGAALHRQPQHAQPAVAQELTLWLVQNRCTLMVTPPA